jgi:hypothetical protein
MSKYLESCNNECKIVMLLLVAVLGFLLYQCYNKPSACAREGFAPQKGGNVEQKPVTPTPTPTPPPVTQTRTELTQSDIDYLKKMFDVTNIDISIINSKIKDVLNGNLTFAQGTDHLGNLHSTIFKNPKGQNALVFKQNITKNGEPLTIVNGKIMKLILS